MSFWLSQYSVLGLDQKHGATVQAACVVQLVDGNKTNYSGSREMSAPAVCANVQMSKCPNEGPKRPAYLRKFSEMGETEERDFIW